MGSWRVPRKRCSRLRSLAECLPSRRAARSCTVIFVLELSSTGSTECRRTRQVIVRGKILGTLHLGTSEPRRDSRNRCCCVLPDLFSCRPLGRAGTTSILGIPGTTIVDPTATTPLINSGSCKVFVLIELHTEDLRWCTSRVFPRHPVLGLTVDQLASGTSWSGAEMGGRSHCSASRS